MSYAGYDFNIHISQAVYEAVPTTYDPLIHKQLPSIALRQCLLSPAYALAFTTYPYGKKEAPPPSDACRKIEYTYLEREGAPLRLNPSPPLAP